MDGHGKRKPGLHPKDAPLGEKKEKKKGLKHPE